MGAYVRNDNEIEKDILHFFSKFPRLAEIQDQLSGQLSGE
jgi:ABC-type branched-subunit amino acid transport system ATPase component